MSLSASHLCTASDLDEFKVKREAVFEFAQKPAVTRSGDHIEVRFETKGFCDVTVAIENDDGRIVRHLASGVLGPNAPAPFQKSANRQVVVWDGKSDGGEYIDDKDSLTIRVSLGLRALFERSLFWSPYKRLHQGVARWGFVGTAGGLPTPRIVAAPEGVYVFEGRGVDHLRLFDHDGKYLRTVYPPPADKLDKIVGLTWYPFPQEGNPPTGDRWGVTGDVVGRGNPLRWFLGDREVLPLKRDLLQTTFLSSGPSGMIAKAESMFGNAATALTVQGRRVALVHRRLNRLATDGSSGDLPLTGPETNFDVFLIPPDGSPRFHGAVGPTSAAFSPDGKTLYCAGFMYRYGRGQLQDCLHGVLRLKYETNDPPAIFTGSMKQNDFGTEDGRFRDAACVDVDREGRVYVGDYMNDRIQVFSADGKHLANIRALKPVMIRIHRRTQEIYVFSWMLEHWSTLGRDVLVLKKEIEIPAHLTVLGPYDDPKPRATYLLPLLNYISRYRGYGGWGGLEYTAEIDSWTDPPRLWLVPGHPGHPVTWAQAGTKVLALRDGGRLELLRDFGADAEKAVMRLEPPMFGRQRLVVNPKTGLLYVLEGQTHNYKAVVDFLEINPQTGAVRQVPAPFDFDDMTIDAQGSFLFRSADRLARYDLTSVGRGEVPARPEEGRRYLDAVAAQSWNEVPFDYGVETKSVGTTVSGYGRRTHVVCAIPLYNGTDWHKGGLSANMKGDILVSCFVTKGGGIAPPALRTDEAHVNIGSMAKYAPVLYPGRVRFGEVHIWAPHGRLLHEDAVKGLSALYGVGLDKDDNIYVMAAATRVLDGTRYFDPLSSTLMKFKPGAGKVVSENTGYIHIPVTRRPDRPYDITNAWVEGAEWFYGGVGYSGQNAAEAGGHCSCWNARFALDYFARSFVPEVRRFHVAVLDTNGNLITRIGQYGNVDAGTPGTEDIPLMHGAYVATHTDRRLFIADPGNARIVSAKLGYHANERVALEDVPDAGRPR